jgi:acetyl-CoA C-acetyltransferase
MTDVLIYDSLRTPRGRGKAGKGALSQLHPQELLAQTLNHMADRAKLDKHLVEDVVIGCVTQVREQGACVARNALIAAEWPDEITGATVNRFCGSGLEGINTIAGKIGAGFIDAGIGGGVESMSRVPMGSDDAMIDGLNEKMRKRLFMVPQGISADLIATRYGFTRADVDKFALNSQQKAARARAAGRFESEITSVTIPQRKGEPKRFETDEFIRAESTLEVLAKLKPAFRTDGKGSVTAGNSSGLNDGAAALLIASEQALARHRLKPAARIVASAVAGVEPRLMGMGPVPASRKALEQAGLSLDEMDVIELNEAFAAQSLACLRELGIADDDPRVNPNGGAIALGHPLGMSGARLVLTATRELERMGKRYALATMCIGVGQGMATVIERV